MPYTGEVVAELSRYELLGIGIIGRVVAKVQRQHLAQHRQQYGH